MDEREDFLNNPTSSRHAMNSALTAWHLVEWVFGEFGNSGLLPKVNTVREYQDYIKTKNNQLQLVNDLADGSKHFKLHRKQSILNTEVKRTGEKLGITKTLKEDALYVIYNDTANSIIISFDDILYSVCFFWYGYFRDVLNLSDEVDEMMKSYTYF